MAWWMSTLVLALHSILDSSSESDASLSALSPSPNRDAAAGRWLASVGGADSEVGCVHPRGSHKKPLSWVSSADTDTSIRSICTLFKSNVARSVANFSPLPRPPTQ
eukprot:3376604-Rhodomonas_salina.1